MAIGAPGTDPSLIASTHAALRRDLVRTRILVGEHAGRRTVLADHLVWLTGVVHRHHEAQDALYPMVVRREPGLAPLVATVGAEHAAISAAVGALEEAARDYRSGADGGALLDELTRLDSVLLPHLEREESELVPTAARCLTPRQWTAWHRAHDRGALEVHWLIDGADPGTRASVLGRLPTSTRLLHGWRRGYARRFADVWAGTPAAAVPALTLANYSDWA
jgi:hypothetical protein